MAASELGSEVWVRVAPPAVWEAGTVVEVRPRSGGEPADDDQLFSLQRSDTEISVELANGSGRVAVSAALEREGDLENVKLRNLDYSRYDTKGRGGVDDLTALTHLHEPAILDVLVSAAFERTLSQDTPDVARSP